MIKRAYRPDLDAVAAALQLSSNYTTLLRTGPRLGTGIIRVLGVLGRQNLPWAVVGFLSGCGLGLVFAWLAGGAVHNFLFALRNMRTERLMLKYYGAVDRLLDERRTEPTVTTPVECVDHNH